MKGQAACQIIPAELGQDSETAELAVCGKEKKKQKNPKMLNHHSPLLPTLTLKNQGC